MLIFIHKNMFIFVEILKGRQIMDDKINYARSSAPCWAVLLTVTSWTFLVVGHSFRVWYWSEHLTSAVTQVCNVGYYHHFLAQGLSNCY